MSETGIDPDILDKFIATKSYLAVVFFKEDDKKSMDALSVLEEIDDDLDEVGIMFVKLDDEVKQLKSQNPYN